MIYQFELPYFLKEELTQCIRYWLKSDTVTHSDVAGRRMAAAIMRDKNSNIQVFIYQVFRSILSSNDFIVMGDNFDKSSPPVMINIPDVFNESYRWLYQFSHALVIKQHDAQKKVEFGFVAEINLMNGDVGYTAGKVVFDPSVFFKYDLNERFSLAITDFYHRYLGKNVICLPGNILGEFYLHQKKLTAQFVGSQEFKEGLHFDFKRSCTVNGKSEFKDVESLADVKIILKKSFPLVDPRVILGYIQGCNPGDYFVVLIKKALSTFQQYHIRSNAFASNKLIYNIFQTQGNLYCELQMHGNISNEDETNYYKSLPGNQPIITMKLRVQIPTHPGEHYQIGMPLIIYNVKISQIARTLESHLKVRLVELYSQVDCVAGLHFKQLIQDKLLFTAILA